ncbi:MULTISPECIES: hypothetical protein [Fischerella]|uniref:hypothetical protein n=1 Tax=Fischerella TaxID=1190 RepID=UPI0002EC05A6|nr:MULTISPECIES: hypothetical protein [Fischerella]MBD2435077.1 hypothetical protein [Fischerella sp. FACHB-380]
MRLSNFHTQAAIAGIASILSGLIVVPSANASAIGYAYWGVQTWKDIPIPSGQLTGGVFGRGLYVNDAGGNFISAGNICNWRIDVDFIDASGKTYYRNRGKTVENCTRAGQQKRLIKKNIRPGQACVRLYTAFNHNVASVCHNIHR